MLHILSSVETSTLHSLLNVLTPEDTVAILEDVMDNKEASTIAERLRLKTRYIYIIGREENIDTEHTEDTVMTGYQCLVTLCEKYTPIQTWY